MPGTENKWGISLPDIFCDLRQHLPQNQKPDKDWSLFEMINMTDYWKTWWKTSFYTMLNRTVIIWYRNIYNDLRKLCSLRKYLSGQRIETYSFQDTLSQWPFLNVLTGKQQYDVVGRYGTICHEPLPVPCLIRITVPKKLKMYTKNLQLLFPNKKDRK